MQARPLQEGWRARELEAQERALSRGPTVLSCPAPIDSGGLGRHVRELREALVRVGEPPVRLYTRASSSPPAPATGSPEATELESGRLALATRPLARLSRAWRMWANAADFDRAAARAMPAAEQLIAFNGAALAQLRAAPRRGFGSLSLVSANSHFRQVVRQHARAYERDPIERPWVSRLLARNLAEYGHAQRILVSSEYIRESFVREGYPEGSLVHFPLTPHPRYSPSAQARERGTFDILFVGSLTVHKGIPLLIDALRALRQDDIRLVLVGGWGTRAMRRYLEHARERDGRISFAPGDPLASMHSARVLVHPAWEDGFGYAPAEALACGLPVIVSEDTGMKELIEPGRTGLVTATGDEAALVEAIAAAYRGEIF
jgi:glycosyltransferase involved in cell wall biosynthesis